MWIHFPYLLIFKESRVRDMDWIIGWQAVKHWMGCPCNTILWFHNNNIKIFSDYFVMQLSQLLNEIILKFKLDQTSAQQTCWCITYQSFEVKYCGVMCYRHSVSALMLCTHQDTHSEIWASVNSSMACSGGKKHKPSYVVFKRISDHLRVGVSWWWLLNKLCKCDQC